MYTCTTTCTIYMRLKYRPAKIEHPMANRLWNVQNKLHEIAIASQSWMHIIGQWYILTVQNPKLSCSGESFQQKLYSNIPPGTSLSRSITFARVGGAHRFYPK